jgi:hypothetical protein
MGMDEIADRARLAYKKVTGGDGEILWRKVGRHSHAETFCLQGRHANEEKMVVQIFVEPSDKLIMNERYERVMEISKVYGQNDLCRFVKPIACLTEYDGIVTDYIEGVDFWPTVRKQCRRLSWTGIDALLRQIQDLAVWTVRLDQQTRRDTNCDKIIQSSLDITTDKVNAIQTVGFFSKEQAKSCMTMFQKLAEELSRQPLYSIMCHGDLCPANILISAPYVYVVDIHRTHRGLPLEDVAYFLSTIDILLMESYRYNPTKVERMKTVFLDTYWAHLKPSDLLYDFQYLTAQVQVLHYYTSMERRFSGLRNIVNRLRMKNLYRRLLELINNIEKTGVWYHVSDRN